MGDIFGRLSYVGNDQDNRDEKSGILQIFAPQLFAQCVRITRFPLLTSSLLETARPKRNRTNIFKDIEFCTNIFTRARLSI